MTITHNVAEILKQHVTLEVEGIDRTYLTTLPATDRRGGARVHPPPRFSTSRFLGGQLVSPRRPISALNHVPGGLKSRSLISIQVPLTGMTRGAKLPLSGDLWTVAWRLGATHA
jgi:hypothetical protein